LRINEQETRLTLQEHDDDDDDDDLHNDTSGTEVYISTSSNNASENIYNNTVTCMTFLPTLFRTGKPVQNLNQSQDTHRGNTLVSKARLF